VRFNILAVAVCGLGAGGATYTNGRERIPVDATYTKQVKICYTELGWPTVYADVYTLKTRTLLCGSGNSISYLAATWGVDTFELLLRHLYVC
jgi:hypothetical protein